MAADYAYVGFFLIVGVLFVILNIEIISRIIRPNHPSPQKLTTYECGEEPIGIGWVRFHVRYYLYALVYILETALSALPHGPARLGPPPAQLGIRSGPIARQP